MISLHVLYKDYVNTSTQTLKDKIRSELSLQIGAGFDSCCQRLERCFEQTEKFTNTQQKNGQPNGNGIFTRKSGEPYINHTLRVALILIRERITDFDVILAAIMHDLFEDTSYTYEMAEREFGGVVADLINCVTNVTESQRKMELTEAEADNIDYANIIKRCSGRRIAFYIKFADRLDNLMTISSMPRDKQLKKVSDTKKYLLPLMEMLGARRFKSYIENAIFKIESALEGDGVNDYEFISRAVEYSYAFQSTAKTVEALRHYFCITQRIANGCRIVYPTIYEISQQLKEQGFSAQQFKQNRFRYNVYLLVDEGVAKPSIASICSAILAIANEQELLAVEGITGDGVELVDDIQNHYLLKAISPVEYNIMQFGSTESQLPIVESYTIEDELTPDKILVYHLPDSEPKHLPRGSTVTDFAFSLGDEVGLFLAAARVNGEPADFATELHDKDKIEVFTTDIRNLYTIKVSWLLHCKTARAKHSLCTHLQGQIDRLIERINKYEK